LETVLSAGPRLQRAQTQAVPRERDTLRAELAEVCRSLRPLHGRTLVALGGVIVLVLTTVVPCACCPPSRWLPRADGSTV
jgi:hypothetical protein